jgi:tetratricopeptide (TPR) repeat protein
LEVPGAWLAAAIFAVHPVEVESVAWITERKTILSGMFYLLALLAFFRYRPLTAVTKEDRVSDWRFYLLGLFLFLSALLSKTVACSLPAVMVLLIWWKRGRVEKRDVYVLTPLFVIGAALGLMTAWLEKYHLHAGMDWPLSFVQRCLLAGRALWFYTGKLFWPYQLSFMYPRWEIHASVWWQYLFPLSAAAVLIAVWLLRRRVGKAPLVAVLVFAVILFPALGFFDVFFFRYSFVADHFQYLASVGLVTLAASAAAKICERTRRPGKHIGTAVSATALIVLGVLTWQQGWSFRDDETLWRHTLANNPNSWSAHWFLGYLLQDSGRLSEAIGHLEQALRINPGYAEAHNTLGLVLLKQGKVQEAIGHYEQALRIKPDLAAAHYNLGIALRRRGRLQEAISHYEQALRLKADYAEAHYNLGNALLRAGKAQEAIGHYEQALRLKPDSAAAHCNLGVALEQVGRVEEGIQQYEQALRIKPDFVQAQTNLARARAAR